MLLELSPAQVAARNQKALIDELKHLKKLNNLEASMTETMHRMLEDHKKEIKSILEDDHEQLRNFLMSECDQANQRTMAIFRRKLGRVTPFKDCNY